MLFDSLTGRRRCIEIAKSWLSCAFQIHGECPCMGDVFNLSRMRDGM